jgi:hypothetical protein
MMSRECLHVVMRNGRTIELGEVDEEKVSFAFP